jgi:hypothetical protein
MPFSIASISGSKLSGTSIASKLSGSSASVASTSAESISSLETNQSRFNPIKALKKAFKRNGSKPNVERRQLKTFIRQSSQHKFKDSDQTAIVFDFDDTLFPTTFLEGESGLEGKTPADIETHMMNEFEGALSKIEECQAAAESMLQCALSFGRVFIVTLSTRGIFKNRCEAWYPRVWKLFNESQITVVHAMDIHRASLQAGQKNDNSNFSSGHWAFVKGKAIAKELDRFYSQYEGQTWKNVISVGDSNFERYGTLGAASAHVQNKICRSNTSPDEAYVKGWQSFDNDPDWSEALEGVHEGRIFKVRAKVVKMKDAPSPFDLADQLTIILDCLPELVGLDSCLNYQFDGVNEESKNSLASALGISCDDSDCEVTVTEV